MKIGITRDMWDNQQARGPDISNKRLRRVLKTLSRLVSYLQALQAGRGALGYIYVRGGDGRSSTISPEAESAPHRRQKTLRTGKTFVDAGFPL
ncbi:hypothetical protein ACU6Z7_26485 [Klebsiella aerogenes]